MPQPICPRCFSVFVKRSRRRNILESAISLVSIYPFRCQLCQHRFSLHHKGVKYQRVDEDRREYQRLPANLAATFTTGAISGQGTLMDISMAGCSLSTESRLEVGNTFYLKLLLPEHAYFINVEVAILRGIRSNHASVEFIRFEGGEREKLQHLIRNLISEGSSQKAQIT